MEDSNNAFYDDLAPLYHLLYPDWEKAVVDGGRKLDAFIRARWESSVSRVLDAAAGIGTQALGLARLGYDVTASDVSAKAIHRARHEAASRGLQINFANADLRNLSDVHDPHDLVMAFDNVLPHLPPDDDILRALRECYRCTVAGGGCLFSVRDYSDGDRRVLVPQGAPRVTEKGRIAIIQLRDWHDDDYDIAFLFVEDLDGTPRTRVIRGGRYHVVAIDRLLELMREAGYVDVHREDDSFFQPVLVGTRPREAR